MFHWFKKHTKDGIELPDDTPIAIPVTDRPLSIQEQIARFTASEDFRQAARNNGLDTFEEADDFDIPGSMEFKSPYEMQNLEEEEPIVQTRMDEIRAGSVLPQDESRLEAIKTRLAAANEKKLDQKDKTVA